MSWEAELSPGDAALCRRETGLSGLAAVLLAPATAASLGLGDLRQSYLRYKPGTNCVAGLVRSDGKLGAWTAITYPATRWPDIRRRPKWTTGHLRALFLDDVCTVLVPLALERRLPNARRLSDGYARMRLLRKIGLADCDLRILRYKPGRRIVLRADGPEGPRALVKLHARVADYTRALAGAVQAEGLGGPAIVGRSRRHLVIATKWTQGDVLSPTSDSGDFALAGAALARHHEAAATDRLRPWRPAGPDQAVDAIGELVPDLARQARKVADQLPALAPAEPVALHGDFSADQVVRGPTGATLLDWDRTAFGPAARDLGSALARLDLDAIRGAQTEDASAALLDGYAAVRPLPECADITAHRAHALLALAVDGFRDRRPQWHLETRHVLDQVARLCLRRTQRLSPRPMPGLGKALDKAAMQAVLGGQLDSVSLTRLKPGRRAMLRYGMKDGSALLGKLRAKGPDLHAPGIQAGLRHAGLDGTAGVGVPEMAGRIEKPALWLQQLVPGQALGDLLDAAECDGTDAMRRTGRALATLHACPPQTLRCWSHEDEFAVLSKALSKPRHADLLDLAERRLSDLPPAPEVGLHRDFYPDQVLVAPDTVWLVDLDLHARGDAAVDIGNFLAHLTELALRRGYGPGYFAPLHHAFMQGYESCLSAPDPHRVDTLHWISLARHIAIAERFSDRRHAIGAIEKLCREGLAAGPASPSATHFFTGSN